MGLYIKDMKMPKTESEVLIIAIKSDGSVYPVRIDGDGQPMVFPNEEMKNCAVPVPEPHGDLIERNALFKKSEFVCTDDDEDIRAVRYSIIENAPTVIPASEEKEDTAKRDYEAAAEYQQYCEMYEQTYDPETGAM